MTTIIKRKSVRKTTAKKITPLKSAISENGTFKELLISDIDRNPRNYRRVFIKSDIEAFSKILKKHGLISPITVRPSGDRYELVVGERRFRAAVLAKMISIPAQVRILTDEEVTELQLSENMNRENPHPFYEAQAVALLVAARKSIEEIAKRLGRSKSFVYSRIKISELIEPLQEFFLNNKMTTQQAETIASLAPATQFDFFDAYCNSWESYDYSFDEIDDIVESYKLDLNQAPFDLADKALNIQAGACTNCPFNSATLNYLFPELAKEAQCSNRSCYLGKCETHKKNVLSQAFEQFKPDALIYTGYIPQQTSDVIETLPELAILPRYNRYAITHVTAPSQPTTEEYEDTDEEGNGFFDEAGYQQALQEYYDELETYHEKVKSTDVLRGLKVDDPELPVVLFELQAAKEDSREDNLSFKVTAKEVQQAIKEGKATPELLEKEIERINDLETRRKEIDLDKIQEQVHEQFKERVNSYPDIKDTLTDSDQVALRLIVFNALDWSNKSKVQQHLFPSGITFGSGQDKVLFEALAALSEEQFCFLIRSVLIGESQSQYPGNIFGYALYQAAEAAGVDVETICKVQDGKATIRQEKQAEKIKDLEKKIAKLKL